jgi:hypothetical protein
MSEKITNLSKFIPKGALGQLFQQARALNHLNEQLSEHLPEQFALLSLCTIKDNTATFVTDNLRDLCINRSNHQKPTFHPLGDFLNSALALLGQGLKKSPIGQKLDFTIPIYAKAS